MQKLINTPLRRRRRNYFQRVKLDKLIDPSDDMSSQLRLRLSDDLMDLWKWTVDKITSESSTELRKLIYQFCKETLGTSFNDAFAKESICPNCKENLIKPWLMPKHQALECKTLTLT